MVPPFIQERNWVPANFQRHWTKCQIEIQPGGKAKCIHSHASQLYSKKSGKFPAAM